MKKQSHDESGLPKEQGKAIMLKRNGKAREETQKQTTANRVVLLLPCQHSSKHQQPHYWSMIYGQTLNEK
jgi:hypothetical protein